MMLNNYSKLYMHWVKNGTSIDTFNVMFKNTNNETNGYKAFKTLFNFLQLSIQPLSKESTKNLNKTVDLNNKSDMSNKD